MNFVDLLTAVMLCVVREIALLLHAANLTKYN